MLWSNWKNQMSSNIESFVLTFFEGSSQFLFNLNFKRDENIISFPSRHEMSLRCLNHHFWDLHWERLLKDVSETSQKRRLFCDVFKTSQIHFKKDIFFATFLRRLKYISIDVFFVTSLRRLKFIWKKMFAWCLSQ